MKRLNSLTAARASEYKRIEFNTEEKTFYLPSTKPWVVNFGDDLNDEDLNIFIKELETNNFTLFNDSVFLGNSFTLSSMVYDENKKNFFSIDMNNHNITIIPYEKNISESFIKLFEVISDFDPSSELRSDIF